MEYRLVSIFKEEFTTYRENTKTCNKDSAGIKKRFSYEERLKSLNLTRLLYTDI